MNEGEKGDEMKVTIEIDGKEVSPKDFQEELGRSVVRHAVRDYTKTIEHRLGDFRCPEHHEPPKDVRIVVKKEDVDEVTMNVHWDGCCEVADAEIGEILQPEEPDPAKS